MTDPAAPPADPRFLADAMLARLARWLRVLGFDTVLHPSLPDRELVSLAARQDRLLLTCDRHLVEHLRPARALLVRSHAPLDQLREVVEVVRADAPRALFTRCLVCNAPLRPVEPGEAAALAPESALAHGDVLWRCPGCGRVYWPGSHTRRMRAALARAFPDWLPPAP